MSDFDDYEEEDPISLDDVIEDELHEDDSPGDWSDNLDDMDSGDWGNQYSSSKDEIDEDDIDPWDLN